MNKGIVQAVGIGPGSREGMTYEAYDALERSDVIVGYQTYVELIRPYFPDKEYVVNGMRKEADRCRRALKLADEGKCVSIISSGDAAVYGMAGLVMELAEKEYPDVQVRAVAGVTAALSGSACLGAPLGHDFVCISLSDLLTPWEIIEKRLRCAAEGDFCICLYNPGSHHRTEALKKAAEIILESRKTETVCGYVRNIGREGQEKRILTLGELTDIKPDMLMTVFIGNSQTRVIHDQMVTPRGYRV